MPVTAVAIIPARGGSRRIPHKNVKPFLGKPIICYSLETAKASGCFDSIYVTTDDEDIADVAARFGVPSLIRETAYAVDTVGTQEVVKQALNHLPTFDYACCIYATAPLMLAHDLIAGYQRIQEEPVPFVFSVCPRWVDAGQWYWGKSLAFTRDIPLERGAMHVIPDERVCDINTMTDWHRAEQLYKRLHGGND